MSSEVTLLEWAIIEWVQAPVESADRQLKEEERKVEGEYISIDVLDVDPFSRRKDLFMITTPTTFEIKEPDVVVFVSTDEEW